MEKLGYRRNGVARNLKTKKSNTIAVLLPQAEIDFLCKKMDNRRYHERASKIIEILMEIRHDIFAYK